MKELQTITGIDIPVKTRGVLYLCQLTEKKLIVRNTILFDNASDALNAYANIPNAESQLAYGKTFDELIMELQKLHQKMKNPKWIKQLHEVI